MSETDPVHESNLPLFEVEMAEREDTPTVKSRSMAPSAILSMARLLYRVAISEGKG